MITIEALAVMAQWLPPGILFTYLLWRDFRRDSGSEDPVRLWKELAEHHEAEASKYRALWLEALSPPPEPRDPPAGVEGLP